MPKGHIFDLGDTSELMQKCGLENLPIELKAEKLANKKMQANHPYPAEVLRDLVKAINNPLAIFRSISHPGNKDFDGNYNYITSDKDGSFVIMTDIKHNGEFFILAISPKTFQDGRRIYSVRSIYPKNNRALLTWLADDWDDKNNKQNDKGNVKYLRQDFEQVWYTPNKYILRSRQEATKKKLRSKQQSNSADVRTELKYAANIVQLFKSPKYFEEKNKKKLPRMVRIC